MTADVFQEKWIDIDGTSIHYFDTGNEDAEDVILFIHGFSGSGYEMKYLAPLLLPQFRIISPDLPGHGFSDKPDMTYSLEYLVESVKKFKDAMGLVNYYVIGHSMGGQISVCFASKYPEGIQKIVFLAPFGLDGEAGPLFSAMSKSKWFIDLAGVMGNRFILEQVINHVVVKDPRQAPKDWIDYLDQTLFKKDGLRPLLNITFNVFATNPVDSLLPQIDFPILIIWGKNDRVLRFKKWSGLYATLLPNAELVPFAECGHMPHIEKAEETAGLVIRFFASKNVKDDFYYVG